MDKPMFSTCNTGKNSPRLSLITSTENRDFIRRKSTKLIRSGKIFIRNLDITEFTGSIDIGFHRASEDDNLTAELPACFNNLLNTANIGRESRDDKTSGSFRENILDALDNRLFRTGIPLLLGIRRISPQQIDSLISEMNKFG